MTHFRQIEEKPSYTGGIMAGFADILGALVQSGMSQSSTKRLTNAFGAGGGSLSDIVGGLAKMVGGAGGQSQSGGLGGMLGDVLGNLSNNKAALGGLGALGGALLGGGKSSAKGAVGGGALAMLASLAFSALKSAGQAPAQPPKALLEVQTPEQEKELDEEANLLVKAMINAAKADGAIDQAELQKIIGKFEEDGLSQDDKDFFMVESARPLDISGLIAAAAGRPDLAAQIYAASLLAIEVDTAAEEQYMQKLASGLQLAPATVSYIETTLAK
jgi:uncharacterized membrane protein YebE (DUF533 family)